MLYLYFTVLTLLPIKAQQHKVLAAHAHVTQMVTSEIFNDLIKLLLNYKRDVTIKVDQQH